jgi:DNA-directed RNA polymerase subunit L
MDIKVLNSSKEEMEIEIPSLTLVELLRVYLNEDSNVTFAAWKREHPSRNPVLKINAKDSKKAFHSAIEKAVKDLDSLLGDFKTLK